MNAQTIIVETVSQYNRIRGVETRHPLITILDYTNIPPLEPGNYVFQLYAIYLKELKCGELKYGRGSYDYEEGTLVCTAPGQRVGIPDRDPSLQPKGWAILFHPDLIKGTSLGRTIDQYNFFSYEANEALHVSEKERQILLDCLHKIEYELDRPIDKHSKTLISANLEVFLGYCMRFYDRQFITRDQANKGVLERFESLLKAYFQSDEAQHHGLPSVAHFANALNLSPNYFGDLVRKETGISAQEYIQSRLIDLAKTRILQDDASISEVAYALGFKYPQHFTRLFKQKVGMTPQAYRTLN